MRSSKQKPARWMWALAAGVMAAGLLLVLPFAPALLRERLSGGLVGGGAIVLAVLFFQRQRYRELPPEERRELDAEDGDERVQMIRQRAAWRCSQAEDVALLAAALLYAVFYDPVLPTTSRSGCTWPGGWPPRPCAGTSSANTDPYM